MEVRAGNSMLDFETLLKLLNGCGLSNVTFVTFFGDKKCDASHFSHFWEECDALAHENICWTCDVFWHILPETCHILAPPVQNFFWTGRNVTIRLGLKHVFLFLSQICQEKQVQGRLWARGRLWDHEVMMTRIKSTKTEGFNIFKYFQVPYRLFFNF